jgi:hypothetical protein
MVAAYAPWKLNSYRIENVVVYPWVIGYKYNPFNQHPWQYLDIDMSVRERPANDAQGSRSCRRAMALGAHAQPAKWADPNKVLRTAIIIAETGFDPQAAQDLYSNTINSAIFDPPYEYDYLERPHKIVPRGAESLPEISADGLTWTYPDQERHLLRRRSRVQGTEARAHGQRLRLRDQAAHRPEGPLAQHLPRARPSRRHRQGARGSQGLGQARLRQGYRGRTRARPLHPATQARRARLRVPAAAHGNTVLSRRA